MNLPKEHAVLNVRRHFSEEEFQHMQRGVIPEEMEDKWFIFFEGDTLHFHRSWTGYCIYRVHLAHDPHGVVISSIEANRHLEQYEEKNDSHDAQVVLYLIDLLLLGKDVEFPYCDDPASDDERVLQEWSQVGKAILSKRGPETHSSPLRMSQPPEVADTLSLLEQASELNDIVTRAAASLLANQEVSSLTNQYRKCLKMRDVEIGLNVFAIVSDLYFRENFHSDVLRVLLDPQTPHGELNKFLHLFLAFLRSHGVAVQDSDYGNSIVTRETGRIDVGIKDDDSRKAIIIENKINNAVDQPRQLVNYLHSVRAEGYTCDAIIYLRLSRHGDPDTAGWTEQERKDVRGLLRIVNAFDDTASDLLSGWIGPCIKQVQHPDAKYLFSQYGALLRKLGGNIMNKPVMKAFYTLIREGNNFETAQSIKAMFDELVLYRVERIVDEFKTAAHPFNKVGNWRDGTAFFMDCFWGEAHLALDIGVSEDGYSFWFWDRNDKEGTKGRIKQILERMKCLKDYKLAPGGYQKLFKFPSQDEALFEEIRTFQKKLAAVVATPP